MNIRRYRERDRTAVTALINRIWGLPPAEADRLFALKYFENPYRENPMIAVLEGEGGEICGVRPLFYLPFRKNKDASVLHVFQPADAFLIPKARGRGNLQKMLAFLCREIEAACGNAYLLLSMSANEDARKSHLQFGFTPLSSTSIWGKNEIKGLLWKVLPPPPISFGTYCHSCRDTTCSGSSLTPDAPRIRQNLPDCYLGPSDDPRFWEWRNRFTSHPLRSIRAENKGDHTEAFCVMREYRGNEFHVQYFDYSSPECLTKLLGHIASKFAVGRMRVEIPATNSDLSRTLRQAGFKIIGASEVLIKTNPTNSPKPELRLDAIFADRFF